MDSSDSDDDCYGNIAQKLQLMKNKIYKAESAKILDDSIESNENTAISKPTEKKKTKSSPKKEKVEDVSVAEDQDSVLLDNSVVTSGKRMTRSAAKRASSDASVTESSAPKKANRRKRGGKASKNAANADKSEEIVQNVVEIASPASTNRGTGSPVTRGRGRGSPLTRGRGRGRGRNRGRNQRQMALNALWGIHNNAAIPTYSVGNTEEYPDQSDCQQLFSAKPKSDDVVIVEDNDVLDENEELSVKVYWQSSEYFKFNIRRFQKLTQIFDYFANKENVSYDKLLFTFNDRILKSDDTPDAINYSIVKFIDGGIVNQSVSKLIKNDNVKTDRNGIKIKFQCQNVKKPFETYIGLDERLAVAMIKCAEHFETSLDKVQFQFDGDLVSGKSTPKELELEGGECIDVKIIS